MNEGLLEGVHFLNSLFRTLLRGFSCLPQSWASLVAQLVKNPPAMQQTWGLIPGLGRSAGEGNGYPLQYSGLENSMD